MLNEHVEMRKKPEFVAEIERKFLIRSGDVHKLLNLRDKKKDAEIEQGWVTSGDFKGKRIRRKIIRDEVGRISSEKFYLSDKRTVTEEGGQSFTEEQEEVIDETTFYKLWSLTEGKRIFKKRHYIPVEYSGNTYTVELDLFIKSGLENSDTVMCLAEIEFDGSDKDEKIKNSNNFNSKTFFENLGLAFREVTDEFMIVKGVQKKVFKNKYLAENPEFLAQGYKEFLPN